MTQYAPPPAAGHPQPPVPPGPTGLPYGGPPPAPGYVNYYPQPSVRKSSAGKVIGIVAGVLVAVLAGIFVLVMAFGSPVVTDDRVEQEIVSQFGLAPGSVSCPSSLEGEVGAEMTCTATDGGVSTPVLVQVTGLEGDMVNFTMTPQ
jgi:hypothetical protein